MAKRKFTLADVAQEAGVSIMTVSRVVNNKGEISEETRRLVQSVIDRMQYRPNRAARSLVTHRTYAIGVVVPDITNPYFANIVRGVEDEAWAHGYNILLVNTVEELAREEAALRLLEETEAEGLVMAGPRLPARQLHSLVQRHKNVVTINREIPEHLGKRVQATNNGLMLQIEHMLERGRHRLAVVSHKDPNNAPADNNALKEAERRYDISPTSYIAAPTWEAGYEWMQANCEVLAGAVDGIICSNDLIALGALQACKEEGLRVPDDLAVIGNDNIMTGRMTSPALTTLHSPQYEMGQAAMQALLVELDPEFEPTLSLDFEYELIIREST